MLFSFLPSFLPHLLFFLIFFFYLLSLHHSSRSCLSPQRAGWIMQYSALLIIIIVIIELFSVFLSFLLVKHIFLFHSFSLFGPASHQKLLPTSPIMLEQSMIKYCSRNVCFWNLFPIWTERCAFHKFRFCVSCKCVKGQSHVANVWVG